MFGIHFNICSQYFLAPCLITGSYCCGILPTLKIYYVCRGLIPKNQEFFFYISDNDKIGHFDMISDTEESYKISLQCS